MLDIIFLARDKHLCQVPTATIQGYIWCGGAARFAAGWHGTARNDSLASTAIITMLLCCGVCVCAGASVARIIASHSSMVGFLVWGSTPLVTHGREE